MWYYGIMCHRWVAEVDTLETKKRKDTMMTESYENWESGIDWSRRTSVVGGPAFYVFIKAKAIPALEDGLRQLEATKANCEDRMRRWGGIAERAEKLSASFAALTECEDFMTLIHDFDEKTAAVFAGERIWTLSDWLRIGKKLTDAMRDGSSVPTKYASELAGVRRDMASASAVRNILRSFVSAAMLKLDRIPDFLHGIGEAHVGRERAAGVNVAVNLLQPQFPSINQNFHKFVILDLNSIVSVKILV